MGRVYSTGVGRICPTCGAAVAACRCRRGAGGAKGSRRSGGGGARSIGSSGRVEVRLEKKGRRGKTVTVVLNLPLTAAELAAAAKELKTRCGTGGSVREGTIELQGDRVATVREWLAARGGAD